MSILSNFFRSRSTGYLFFLAYLQILYNSEIEDRIWIEKDNDYESWDNYLKRKITQIKKELKNTIL